MTESLSHKENKTLVDIQNRLDRYRTLLKVAQEIEGNVSIDPSFSEEISLIQRRQQQGESIGSIVNSLAADVRSLYEDYSKQKMILTVSLERDAIRQARLEEKWVIINPEVPPVKNGLIRVFRGVKPFAISTEYAGPLNESEQVILNTLIKKVQLETALNDQELKQLSELGARALTSQAKFFTDDYQAAVKYANGGAVYYVDLDPAELTRYRKENRNPESAFAIPSEIAKNSEPYAVGSAIEEDTILKPRSL